MQIRSASPVVDGDGIWAVLEPTIRAGETYTLPRNMSRQEALDYWFAPQHEVFVAEDDEIVGTYFLQPNQRGAGSPVANGGSVAAPWATGRRVARGPGAHSLERAREPACTATQLRVVRSTHQPPPPPSRTCAVP